MNESELERFADELRRVPPAKPPAELMTRLAAACRESRREDRSLEIERARASDWAAGEGPVGLAEGRDPQSNRAGTRRYRRPRSIRYVFSRSAVDWGLVLRWLLPGAAAAAALALVLRLGLPAGRLGTEVVKTAETTALKADDVQIDRQLVSSFETVARLPDGEPVRFRCRQWIDEVKLRDKDRGLVIEQRVPRVEVVPVSYEVY